MSITNEQMELIMGKEKELRIEFTEANLKKLKIEKKRYVAYDLKTTGLAIYVYPGGLKTLYFFYTPLNSRKTEQIKLGRWPTTTITGAKAKVKNYWRVINTENDPHKVRQALTNEKRLGQIIEEYYEEELSKKSSSTQQTVKSCFNSYLLNKSLDKRITKLIDYCYYNKFISKVKKADMQHAFDIATKRGIYTANKLIVYSKTLFNYAIKKGYIKINPCVGIELHEEYETNDYLSKDQYWRVINMCFKKDLRTNKLNINHYVTLGLSVVACTVIAWALITGRRQYSEGARIKWSDINWDTKTLKLTKTKTEKNAYIKIPPMAIDLLQTIKNSRMEAMYNYGDERREYVFPSYVKVGPVVNIRKTWSRVLELCEINYIAFKQCRHSFATNFLSSSKNIVSVQKALRHTTAKTTMKYAKLIDEDLDRDYNSFQSPDAQSSPEVIKFPKSK